MIYKSETCQRFVDQLSQSVVLFYMILQVCSRLLGIHWPKALGWFTSSFLELSSQMNSRAHEMFGMYFAGRTVLHLF